MFTGFEIENFRGIERLSVNGLSRVNLIIGKNNAGKTALMEAAAVLAFPDSSGVWLNTTRTAAHERLLGDFESTWRPIFRGGDAERGLLFKATQARGEPVQLSMRKVRGEHVITDGGSFNPNSPSKATWTLECAIMTGTQSRQVKTSGRPDGSMAFSAEDEGSAYGWRIPAGAPNLNHLVTDFSRLKQDGKDTQVRDLLRQLDDRIESLEILSPTGVKAELFVRVSGEPRLLPFRTMGDGVQRSLDIAIGLVLGDVTQLSIDEFENGLHHLVLEPLWKWLATASVSREVQIFATTHSEECVQAACRAFSTLNDDGLRVIRLDRQEHQTVATVYDRQLVEAAGSMGVELRG